MMLSTHCVRRKLQVEARFALGRSHLAHLNGNRLLRLCRLESGAQRNGLKCQHDPKTPRFLATIAASHGVGPRAIITGTTHYSTVENV